MCLFEGGWSSRSQDAQIMFWKVMIISPTASPSDLEAHLRYIATEGQKIVSQELLHARVRATQ